MAINCPKGQIFSKKEAKCVVTKHKIESTVTDKMSDKGSRSSYKSRDTNLVTGEILDDFISGNVERSRMTDPSGEWYEEERIGDKTTVRKSKGYKKRSK